MGLSGAQIADVWEARKSAEDTVRLVNRVLDLSKLEARKMAPCCGPVELRAWLESVVAENYWRARQKGIELVGVVDMNVPLELEIDAMRLTQALQELLDNTLHHTTEGHLLLRVAVCPASTPLEDALRHIIVSDVPIQPCPPPSPSFFARATHFATILTPRFTQTRLKPWTKADVARQSVATEGRAIVGAAEKTAGETPREGEQVREGLGGEGGSEGSRDNSGWSGDGEEEGVRMKCGNAVDSLTGGGGERMQLVVVCEDTGCGFDASFQRNLFEFKGRTESGGAGLGLALMHQLVTLMGGHVACLSHPGIGSTFAFSLPFSSPPSPLAPATAVTHPPATITRGTPSVPEQPLGLKEEGENGGEDGENGGEDGENGGEDGEDGEEDKIWPEDMWGCGAILRHRNRLNRNSSSRRNGGVGHLTAEGGGLHEGQKGEGEEGMGCVLGLEGVTFGVMGSDAYRQELTARILSGLGAQVHLLPHPAAAEAVESSQTRLTSPTPSGLGAHVHLLPHPAPEASQRNPMTHMREAAGSRSGHSAREVSGGGFLLSQHSLNTIHVGETVGSSSRESGGEVGERKLLSSPCQSLSTSHVREMVERSDGEFGGWVMSWFGGKRKREEERGEGRKGREEEEVRESRPWVVVMEGEDLWRLHSEGGGEVTCKVAAGTGSREAAARQAGVQAWSKRGPVVALTPAGAGSWEAAVWQAGVRGLRGVEGMECGALVVGVVVLTDCSGEEAMGDGGERIDEEEEEEKWEEKSEEEEEERGDKIEGEEEEVEERSEGERMEVQDTGVGDAGGLTEMRRAPFCPLATALASSTHTASSTASAASATSDAAAASVASDVSASPSASAPCASATIPPRVVICRRPLLSHHLHHAVQLAAFGRTHLTGGEAGPDDTEQAGHTEFLSGVRLEKELGSFGECEAKEKGAEVLGTSLGALQSDDSSSGGNSVSSRRGDGTVEDTGRPETAAAAAAGAEKAAAAPAAASLSGGEVQRRHRSLPGKGSSAVPQGAGVLAGVGVLVVDDAAVNLVVARRTLTRSGATVATAGSGEEALWLVRHALGLGGSAHHVEPGLSGVAEAVDGHVDVILMDLQMPLMDGSIPFLMPVSPTSIRPCSRSLHPSFAATEAIRAYETTIALQSTSAANATSEASAQLLIVALTADVDDEVTRRCLASGFDGIMQKPVDPKLLSQLLLRMNSRRRLGYRRSASLDAEAAAPFIHSSPPPLSPSHPPSQPLLTVPAASPDRHLVVTASGPDRLGIVSTLAKRILECGGNVEESRMARLAGDFSIIMLIRVDATSPRIAEDLRLKLLEVQGLQVSTRWTVDERSDETAPKRKFRRLVLRGADNPGLVYNVTEYLSSKNINIENLETFTEEAPFGGTMLFLMEGVIAMPIRLPTRQLERQLDALQQSLGVQIELLNLDPKDMVEDWRVAHAAAGRIAAAVGSADRAAEFGPERHGGRLELERQLDALQQSLGVQMELLNLDPKDMVEDWRVAHAAAGSIAAAVGSADRAAEFGPERHGGGLELERQLDALQQSLGVQMELLNLDPKDMVEDWRSPCQSPAITQPFPLPFPCLSAATPCLTPATLPAIPPAIILLFQVGTGKTLA
ncbi:unnamed protein product [Closterium sp. Naga37s-1]|nr:unnamed protein product [Closterium sp. Naga37s-1]